MCLCLYLLRHGLPIFPRLATNLQATCLSLQCSEITAMDHYPQPVFLKLLKIQVFFFLRYIKISLLFTCHHSNYDTLPALSIIPYQSHNPPSHLVRYTVRPLFIFVDQSLSQQKTDHLPWPIYLAYWASVTHAKQFFKL